MKSIILFLIITISYPAFTQVEIIPKDQQNKSTLPDEKLIQDISLLIFKDKKYDEALMKIDVYISRHPNIHVGWFFQGLAYMAIKEYNKAVISFDTSLKYEPGNPTVLSKKAQAFYFLKKYKAAKDLINESVTLGEEDPDAWNTKGLIHKRLKEYRESEKAFIKSTQIMDDFAAGHYNLACLYVVWGKKKQAIVELKKCFEKNEAFKAYAQKDDELKPIHYDADFQALY